jgi:hypothetical protein
MCAKFFRVNKKKKTCTKTQWRSSVDTDADQRAKRHTLDVRTPRRPKIEEHLRGGPYGEPDIPERVWHEARPSAWNGRRGSETVHSTPLGTALSPRFPVAGGALTVRGSRPVPEPLPPRTSIPSLRPNIVLHVPQRTNDASAKAASTLSAELPVVASPRVRHVRSATLRELEGRRAVDSPRNRSSMGTEASSTCLSAVSDLQPAQELTGKHPSIHYESSCTYSPISKPSSDLDNLFAEVHDAVRLPNQEELSLRQVIVCDRGYPAPPSDCPLCEQPLSDRRARTIQFPGCGHFLHKNCLVADFRIREQSIGRCSVCDLALFERGLLDRIETDRQAIFGSQSTTLNNKVCVEFVQRVGKCCRAKNQGIRSSVSCKTSSWL